MKLYLDDERDPTQWKQDGEWKWCMTALCAIEALKYNKVSVISLDHDLGLDDGYGNNPGTGYDVLLWLEAQAFYGHWDKVPDKIEIHTSNISARLKMELAVEAIQRMRGIEGGN